MCCAVAATRRCVVAASAAGGFRGLDQYRMVTPLIFMYKTYHTCSMIMLVIIVVCSLAYVAVLHSLWRSSPCVHVYWHMCVSV